MARLDWPDALLRRPTTWKRVALGVLIALVGAALSTAFVVRTHFPYESLPFVLVILTATVVGRRIAGAVAVVVATLLLDYYTLPPLHRINPRTATEFWGLVTFAAVMLLAAQLVGWLDAVGERERAERDRASLLVRIDDAMASATGRDRAVREVARMLVPVFSDWAIVELVREDGVIHRVAAVHAGGERFERALLEGPQPQPSDDRGVAAVIRSGQTEHREPGPDDDGVRTSDAEGSVPHAPLGSTVIAPIGGRDRTLGALMVARDRGRPSFSDREVSLIEEIAERAALVLDNLRLVELERRSAGLNAVLQELTAALSAAVSAADVGRTVVEQGVRAMRAAAAVFAVRRPDGGVELRESFGHDPKFSDVFSDVARSFSIDDPLPLSQAMRTGRVVILGSIEERDRRFPALAGTPPPTDHALACLPFVVRGVAIGGLAVTFDGPRRFAPWELGFMESIAAQAGQALDRAMLFESERTANARLETGADRLERLLMVAYRLSRARDRVTAARSIVHAGVRAADAASGALLLVDEATGELALETSVGYPEELVGRYTRFPLSSPLPSAEAARTGHPLWLETPEDWVDLFPAGYRATVDAAFEAVATAALPLVVAGRTLGALVLAYSTPHVFGEDERDFLLTLAGLCAQNLQGALVLEERESARADAERGRERIELLAEATRLLSSSLDAEATIAQLGDLCVPRIADWMTVVVAERQGTRRLVLRHTDPGRIEDAERLLERVALDAESPTFSRVVRTGRAELIEDVDDDVLKAVAPDADTLEALRELGLSSAVIVPLVGQNGVLGVLSVAYAESGRRYDRDDLTFLESLSRRAAVAIDNARLFHDREQMSRSLQRSLLPRHVPTIPGAELAVRYIPFGEGHDVGGDFYDVFAGVDDSWGLLIGDVCGKGPEAASIVGIARHTVRGLAMAHSRPSSILEALNRAILDESPSDRFCTACYVRLRADGAGGFRATISLGGHLPPLVLTADGAVRAVGEPGSLLGVLERPELSDAVVDLAPGDLLLLYTDGLEEPSSAAGAWTVEESLAGSAGETADAVANELLRRFRAQGGERPRDDVAVLALRVADA